MSTQIKQSFSHTINGFSFKTRERMTQVEREVHPYPLRPVEPDVEKASSRDLGDLENIRLARARTWHTYHNSVNNEVRSIERTCNGQVGTEGRWARGACIRM